MSSPSIRRSTRGRPRHESPVVVVHRTVRTEDTTDTRDPFTAPTTAGDRRLHVDGEPEASSPRNPKEVIEWERGPRVFNGTKIYSGVSDPVEPTIYTFGKRGKSGDP